MIKEIINFVFIYIITFWMVIFCVLPIGVKREENPLPGNDHGAPQNANIKKKLIYTAIITLVLVSAYFVLKHEGIIDLEKFISE